MDELQISGRRFISSRRIAKDNGYHTDYIGQLIRGGKIKGQKVGRTWYVDAATFDAYLNGEGGALVAEPQPVVEATPEPVEETVEEKIVVPIVAEVSEVKEKIEEPEIKIETKPEVIKIVEEKVEAPVIINLRKSAPGSGGLRYLADEESLLPEISPKDAMTRVMPATRAAAAPVEPQEVATIIEHRPRATRIMFALAGLAAVVFIFSAVVSSALFQTIKVQQGNAASVGYSLQW
jgi:hypothetical protein